MHGVLLWYDAGMQRARSRSWEAGAVSPYSGFRLSTSRGCSRLGRRTFKRCETVYILMPSSLSLVCEVYRCSLFACVLPQPFWSRALGSTLRVSYRNCAEKWTLPRYSRVTLAMHDQEDHDPHPFRNTGPLNQRFIKITSLTYHASCSNGCKLGYIHTSLSNTAVLQI